VRYAFEIAAKRPRRMLQSATKSNALRYGMVLWDEVAEGVSKDYPAVNFKKYYVDAIAARMVTHPGTLDVIVASNLFGDILTDLGAAISGSLGIAPGANINPERTHPSMLGDCESDRRHLGRGADARPSWPTRSPRPHRRRHRAGDRQRQEPYARPRRKCEDGRAGQRHPRRNLTAMHLYVFARFHARAGCEPGVERALKKVLEPARAEAGCLAIHAFRSVRDDLLFYIHSKWQDEAAFNEHTDLPHTLTFVDEISPLIDHPVQAIRTHQID
jgi:quinol monooxygenase YgiN